jgi:hypothetical protein
MRTEEAVGWPFIELKRAVLLATKQQICRVRVHATMHEQNKRGRMPASVAVPRIRQHDNSIVTSSHSMNYIETMQPPRVSTVSFFNTATPRLSATATEAPKCNGKRVVCASPHASIAMHRQMAGSWCLLRPRAAGEVLKRESHQERLYCKPCEPFHHNPHSEL